MTKRRLAKTKTRHYTPADASPESPRNQNALYGASAPGSSKLENGKEQEFERDKFSSEATSLRIP